MTESKAALKRIRLLTSPCLMPRWIGNSCPCCANTSLTMINGSETITIRLWHALLFNVRPYSTRSNALVKSRFAHHTRRFHWRLFKPRKKNIQLFNATSIPVPGLFGPRLALSTNNRQRSGLRNRRHHGRDTHSLIWILDWTSGSKDHEIQKLTNREPCNNARVFPFASFSRTTPNWS